MPDLKLVPAENAGRSGDIFSAHNHDAWLQVCPPRRVRVGGWFSLTYSASYLDPLVRPIIKYVGEGVSDWDLMAAPLFGKTKWIGYLPRGVTHIFISPTDRPGPFNFKLHSIRRVPVGCLLARGFLRDPKLTLMSQGAMLIRANRERRQALCFARGGIPFHKYEAWKQRRSRRFDLNGLDALRVDTKSLPRIHIGIISDSGVAYDADCNLISSVRRENYPSVSTFQAKNADFQDWSDKEQIEPDSGRTGVSGCSQDDVICFLRPSDELLSGALWLVADTFSRYPNVDAMYCDEEALLSDGTLYPVFKRPLSRNSSEGAYPHAAIFFRAGRLADIASEIEGRGNALTILRKIHDADERSTFQLKRVIVRRQTDVPEIIYTQKERWVPARPSVSIIIPNRNQRALLETCLNGIFNATTYEDIEVIIVDNGSDSETLGLYKEYEKKGLRVLSYLEKFNFSAMCNLGAREARHECLLFLNNDVEVIHSDWLNKLVAAAMQAGIGAVGARLLFQSGKIQHAGVVVGMGGYADHVFHSMPGNYDGYLGVLRGTHEVSAVTGACIAIGRDKFWSVKGFDEQNYPVELNDIDLCLRLREAGMRNLLCPDVRLIHHQSATRGFAVRPFSRYAKERAHFRARWSSVIRNDPFFHPALSLYSVNPSLDG